MEGNVSTETVLVCLTRVSSHPKVLLSHSLAQPVGCVRETQIIEPNLALVAIGQRQDKESVLLVQLAVLVYWETNKNLTAQEVSFKPPQD